MKLTKQVPTEPGLYWCWKKEEGVAVARHIERRVIGGLPEMFVAWMGGFLWPSYFTHYAGPIPPPDLPEPDKIEMTGRLYRPAGNEKKKMPPNSLYLLTSDSIPDSFTWIEMKITLEKDNE